MIFKSPSQKNHCGRGDVDEAVVVARLLCAVLA